MKMNNGERSSKDAVADIANKLMTIKDVDPAALVESSRYIDRDKGILLPSR
jgi:hypothetical protein